MEKKIDGNYTISELESAILIKEAAGNELTALNNNDDQKNPITLATFKELAPGKRPKALHLINSTDAPPSNTKFVCSGIVFISGEKTSVSAFRDK